jgi:hypothetical protein
MTWALRPDVMFDLIACSDGQTLEPVVKSKRPIAPLQRDNNRDHLLPPMATQHLSTS